jgi:hemerythrin-like domain-containing protein
MFVELSKEAAEPPVRWWESPDDVSVIEWRQMPVQIGRVESDFSNPLGLLSDCHRRIEHFLDILIRVCDQATGEPLTQPERAALEKALAYFRNSAPKHTADEEESLFPRLRECAGDDARSSLECLAELENDHQTAALDHDLIDRLGQRWLASGVLTAEDRDQIRQALRRLDETYARHIAIEDRELFPLAGRLLEAEQLAEVGREMAERRGVSVGA